MAHADEYHDVEAAKLHLREVHQVGENRINDEHDAKPLFTRDIDLLSFHLKLHDHLEEAPEGYWLCLSTRRETMAPWMTNNVTVLHHLRTGRPFGRRPSARAYLMANLSCSLTLAAPNRVV